MMDDRDMSHDDHIDPLPADPVEAPAALRALDDVVAPGRLRMAVAEAVAEAERAQAPRRLLRRGAFRLALAVAVPLMMIFVLSFEAQRILQSGGASHGTATPSARVAATVALRQPTAPAPSATGDGETLAAHAGPIAFPTWTRAGWHAVGARTDTVAGHDVRTVFYADAAGRRIGYAIADAQLPVAGGQLVVRRGARLRVLDRGATSVVTWRRDGRTCVLAGRGVPVGRLLTLASYAA